MIPLFFDYLLGTALYLLMMLFVAPAEVFFSLAVAYVALWYAPVESRYFLITLSLELGSLKRWVKKELAP